MLTQTHDLPSSILMVMGFDFHCGIGSKHSFGAHKSWEKCNRNDGWGWVMEENWMLASNPQDSEKCPPMTSWVSSSINWQPIFCLVLPVGGKDDTCFSVQQHHNGYNGTVFWKGKLRSGFFVPFFRINRFKDRDLVGEWFSWGPGLSDKWALNYFELLKFDPGV